MTRTWLTHDWHMTAHNWHMTTHDWHMLRTCHVRIMCQFCAVMCQSCASHGLACFNHVPNMFRTCAGHVRFISRHVTIRQRSTQTYATNPNSSMGVLIFYLPIEHIQITLHSLFQTCYFTFVIRLFILLIVSAKWLHCPCATISWQSKWFKGLAAPSSTVKRFSVAQPLRWRLRGLTCCGCGLSPPTYTPSKLVRLCGPQNYNK